jgi:hypothetical protein
MTEQATERQPQRTVHTFLAEMKEWQERRAVRPGDSSGYVRVGEQCKCSVKGCTKSIRSGEECWMYPEGTVECLDCHPKTKRPVVLEVTARECKVCGSNFQVPKPEDRTKDDDEHGLCCSRKCRRTLDKRNQQPANRGQQE